ncbi:MAG: IS630 family transposase, partial [Stellaceae bacterium]
MRTGVEVWLGPGDRERLEAVIGSGYSPQRHVWRARIVLLSVDGVGTMAIQDRPARVSRRSGVGRRASWPRGVDGLLHEATRPAGKPPLSAEMIERVVAMKLAEPPGETTHWTCRAMARAARVGHRTVQR